MMVAFDAGGGGDGGTRELALTLTLTLTLALMSRPRVSPACVAPSAAARRASVMCLSKRWLTTPGARMSDGCGGGGDAQWAMAAIW